MLVCSKLNRIKDQQLYIPAMRRQTMHMENATSIMMGSCKNKNMS